MLPHQIAMVRSDSRAAWDAHDAEAADRLEAALPALREHGSPEDLAAACLGVALVRWRTGRRAEAAQRFIDFALGAFRFEDAPRPWMRLLNFSLFLNLERGEWVDALPVAMLIRRRAAPAGRNRRVGPGHRQHGVDPQQLGPRRRPPPPRGRDRRRAVQPGRPLRRDLIALLIEMGKIDEAVRYNQSLAASPLVSPRREEVLGLANARVLHAQGRFDDALPVALSTLATTEGLYEERASLRAIAAECLLQTGHPRGALEHAQQGLDVLRLHPEAREHMVLLTLQGRAAHAGRPRSHLRASPRSVGSRRPGGDAPSAPGCRGCSKASTEGTALTDVEVEAQAHPSAQQPRAPRGAGASRKPRRRKRTSPSRWSTDAALPCERGLGGPRRRPRPPPRHRQRRAHGAAPTAPEPPRPGPPRPERGSGRALVRRLHRVHVPTAARPAPIAIAEHLSRSVEVARRVLPTRILIEMGGSAGGRVQLAPMELEQLVLNLALYAHDAVPGAAAIRMTAETTGPRRRAAQGAGPARAADRRPRRSRARGP